MRISTVVTSTVFVTSILVSASAIAAEGGDQGKELFEFHGCVQCHGADGVNPASKVVPKIGGLPSDEIVTKAKKILSGEGETDESKLMHAAIYSPAQCDAPPTDVELQTIAAWLSEK